MNCPRCAAFQIYMPNLKCAFPEGVFTPENWNCQTMVQLRVYAGEMGERDALSSFHAYGRNDDTSIGVLHIPPGMEDETQNGYLVMIWYKQRGATGQAWVMDEEKPPQALTLQTAQWILERARE